MSYKNLIAFHNTGNNCYLNSALQALLSCKEFRECVSGTVEGGKGKAPFLNILNDICQKKDNDSTPISNPTLLKQTLSDCHYFFEENCQQDCHECLVNILDVIHENTKSTNPNHLSILSTNNRILKKIPGLIKQANKEWKENATTDGLSFTNYLFSGQLRSNLICQNCNHSRNNFEIINNISLSLPNNSIDIIDSFMDYFGTEILDDRIDCDRCKKKTKTKKILSLWRFPKILILHLKRYTMHYSKGGVSYTRNNCLVDFSPEMVFKSDKNKLAYDLKCVVNHVGSSPHGGHYTSIVKYDREAQAYDTDWVHIDDNTIYKCTEDQLVSKAAYILVYKLR
jgi:ubiquitin C-terminal hydrolase